MDSATLALLKEEIASVSHAALFKSNPPTYHCQPLVSAVNFHSFLLQLAQLTSLANSPLRVWDGLPHSVEDYGISVIAQKAERVVESWAPFDMSLSRSQTVHSNRRYNVYYLLSTGNFLWQARPNGSVEVAEAARGLLYLLAPLVEKYSPAFAALLSYCRRNITEGFVPEGSAVLNAGTRDEFDARFYTKHLETLLRNADFRREATAILKEAMVDLRARGIESQLGKCTSGKRHWRTSSCSVCEPFRWASRNTLVIRPTRLANPVWPQAANRLFKVPAAPPYRDAFVRELQYITSCVDPLEGVKWYPEQGVVLVNHALVYENALKQRRSSAYLMFDQAGDSNTWNAGYRFCAYISKRTRKSLLAAKRPTTLMNAIIDAGWRWEETLELPYEFYSVTALSKFFKTSEVISISTENRRAQKKKREPGQPYMIERTYVAANGASYPIFLRLVTRKGWEMPRWHAALPFKLATNYEDKWSHYIRRRGGRAYWSVAGVGKLVAFKEEYPWAEHFYNWFANITGQLSLDFRLERRNARYSKKVDAVIAGARKHLGPFYPAEDSVIRRIMTTRSPGRLTALEWAALESALPARNKRAILHRIHELADEHLNTVGDYKEYQRSGWFMIRSAKHHRRWLREHT